jgi:carboxyl-terminal processing protease
MISKFDDDHVSLHAHIDGEAAVVNTGEGRILKPIADEARKEGTDFNVLIERWKAQMWTEEALESLLGDTAQTAGNGNIKYGLIDGDIGLLIIQAMGEFADTDSGQAGAAALDKALDGAMALFQGAKAVIVDVSINDGGSDTFARQIASRFAHKRTLAYSRYAGDGSRSRPQRTYIIPSGRLRYAGPVYVLTSNVSVSSAETFTMAMRALHHVTHVGQRTRGAFSELSRRLPNGWLVVLSNEIFVDADGKAWEGVGIPPHMPLRVFPEDGRKASPLNAVRALAGCIRRGSCAKAGD